MSCRASLSAIHGPGDDPDVAVHRSQIPDEQLAKFQDHRAARMDRDNEEVDAVFQGRDERGEDGVRESCPAETGSGHRRRPATSGPTTGKTDDDAAGKVDSGPAGHREVGRR